MKHKPLLALALCAAILALGSCKAPLRYASVHIAEVLPPTGAKTMYIAVSSNYYFNDSFITNAVAIPPGGPYTNIFIDNIAWYADDKDDSGTSRDFWLLAAEDSDENGKFAVNDQYIPFAHITLTDGETLEITTVDFTMPLAYNLDQQQHIVSILHSNPEFIDKNHKVFFTSFNANPAFCISDSLLCKEIIFWGNTVTSYQVYWDKNGDIALSSGDYQTDLISAGLPEYASFILSPLHTY